jgi:hypothetical protein
MALRTPERPNTQATDNTNPSPKDHRHGRQGLKALTSPGVRGQAEVEDRNHRPVQQPARNNGEYATADRPAIDLGGESPTDVAGSVVRLGLSTKLRGWDGPFQRFART